MRGVFPSLPFCLNRLPLLMHLLVPLPLLIHLHLPLSLHLPRILWSAAAPASNLDAFVIVSAFSFAAGCTTHRSLVMGLDFSVEHGQVHF